MRIITSAVFALLFGSVQAIAVPLLPNLYETREETTGFIGLQFDLNAFQPQLIGGVRYTKTDSDNDVFGAKADIALPLMGDHIFKPTVRFMSIYGSPKVQGEAGGGYNFGEQQFLFAIGAQGPYVNGGLNYQMDGSFHPLIGINSLDGAPERKDAYINIFN